MKRYSSPSKSLQARLCARPTLGSSRLDKSVASIFARVEANGDRALGVYTKQFDNVSLKEISVVPQEIAALATQVPKQLREAINTAYQNIQTFHRAQRLDVERQAIETMPGVVCWRESRAIDKVGLYIPGGSAPLVSTVLMLGVPAQIAGCKEIILCTPPNKDGSAEPAICYAAQLCGISKLYMVGGAQAIAAMAIGTKTIPKVDKIFGPGNQYVTAAKQYAARYGVAIDMPAGPSEVMVVADKSANPAFVAADLLSQAEHGPDSQVVLVTTENSVADAVQSEVSAQLADLPRKDIAKQALRNSFCLVVDDLSQALSFANAYAPEHLILSVKQPKQWSAKVVNAGSVFMGNYSPESAGDYASGTNHTLPTNSWARSYSGVSLDSFVKKVTFQKLTKAGLNLLAPTVESMAEAEGLTAHANAVRIRRKI